MNLKRKFLTAAAMLVCSVCATMVKAQAPSSFAGDGVLAHIKTGISSATAAFGDVSKAVMNIAMVFLLAAAAGLSQARALPLYRQFARFDDGATSLDVASLDDGRSFLAEETVAGVGVNTFNIYEINATSNYVHLTEAFPKYVSFGSVQREINYVDFTVAGLQNTIESFSDQSLYVNLLSAAGGGTFTIGKTDFNDFINAVPASPYASSYPLVFTEFSSRGGPGTDIYNIWEMDATNYGQAQLVCELSHLVIGGVWGNNSQAVLLTAPRGTEGTFGQLILLDLNTYNPTVVHEFDDAGLFNATLSIASESTSDGYVIGTAANATSGYAYVWRMNTDGTGFQVVHTFSPNFLEPVSIVLGNDGYAYGVTYSGGTENQGAIFRLKPDGSDFSIRWSFRPTQDGAFPQRILRDYSSNSNAFLVVARDSSGGGGQLPIVCDCFTVGQFIDDGQALTVAPAAFFTSQAPLGGNWYYTSYFGYYDMADFPFIYHMDMGWEYFYDAQNSANGAYFYDFTDNAFFYTQPSLFPYLYDFNRDAWMYYCPQTGSTDRFSSSPRVFYDYSTKAWVTHL